MTKAIPTIQGYMTTTPRSIGADQPMSIAHRIMREHRIRHLPVLRHSKVVGLVSDRDLNVLETLDGVDPQTVRVEEAMTQEPYVVAPDTPLDEVLSTMAETKYGSAVIAQHGKVVGIFTTVDACRVLADLLQAPFAEVLPAGEVLTLPDWPNLSDNCH